MTGLPPADRQVEGEEEPVLRTPETASVEGVSTSTTTRQLLLVTNVVQPIPALQGVPVEVVPLDHALTGEYLSKFTDVVV